ncbi:MAG: hypothetical protein H0W73_00980 [Bacteroidetes bacterium]|nr:hypothetical protein [Bacteroidota bacterium]
MDRLLNKNIAFIFFFLLGINIGFAQQEIEEQYHDTKDYKDPAQFEKFRKKRMIIASWQINQLKNGALVVRLKTSKKLVDALRSQGKTVLADEKQLEQDAININTMRAYINNYTFSKVYFMYSNYSDSLLNGKREGIFVDTTLTVDSKIVMNEKFYLLAERDYTYNSSIGFVPEDSARIQIEKGNAIKEVPIVIKNKYGHQLKGPFPYYAGEKFNQQKKIDYVTYITINGISIPFNVGGTKNSRSKKTFKYKGVEMDVNIPKHFTYPKIAASIERINEYLIQFHQGAPPPDLSRIDPDVIPLLY